MVYRLRELRKARGLSIRKVACRLGVSHNAVWQWENGKCDLSRSRIPIEPIAEVYGVKDEVLKLRFYYEYARKNYG